MYHWHLGVFHNKFKKTICCLILENTILMQGCYLVVMTHNNSM